MRGRTQTVFMRFDPAKRSALDCLLHNAHVLPDGRNTDQDDSGTPPSHTFLDGDFRVMQPFLEELKQEVASEMEVLWDRSDPTINPAISDEWQYHVERLVKAEQQRREKGAEGTGNGKQAVVANDTVTAPRAQAGEQRKYVPEVDRTNVCDDSIGAHDDSAVAWNHLAL